MTEFNKDKLDEFLGVVRKYMQVRGPMSQKDLSVKTKIGVSTMSRFMSSKVTDINPQIVAKICAVLDIPLHEMIDFVEESYTKKFVRLVKFYKEESGPSEAADRSANEELIVERRNIPETIDDALLNSLSSGTANRTTTANVKIGTKTTAIPFSADDGGRNSHTSIKEKLENLTPRQKAYMSDFLNLDMESRDLVVDLGNNLFRYFRQKENLN